MEGTLNGLVGRLGQQPTITCKEATKRMGGGSFGSENRKWKRVRSGIERKEEGHVLWSVDWRSAFWAKYLRRVLF